MGVDKIDRFRVPEIFLILIHQPFLIRQQLFLKERFEHDRARALISTFLDIFELASQF